MKKHFMAVLAVVLAIGASAFTTLSTAPSKTLTDYYWYQPDEFGVVQPNTELFSNTAVDLPTADANDGCNGSGAECIRGFEQRILEETGDPGQAHTEKND